MKHKMVSIVLLIILALAFGAPLRSQAKPRQVKTQSALAVPFSPNDIRNADILSHAGIPSAFGEIKVHGPANTTRVVVIGDSGVVDTMPDLAGRVVRHENMDENFPFDQNAPYFLNHGTRMAGIIGSIADNDRGNAGVMGIYPQDIAFISLYLGPSAENVPFSASVVAKACRRTAELSSQYDIAAINFSIGCGDSVELGNALRDLGPKKIKVFCAAGQSTDGPEGSTNLNFPAAYAGTPGFEHVIAVTGTIGSEFDRVCNYGPKVAFAAPNQDVPALGIPPFEFANSANGTSSATALVCGSYIATLAYSEPDPDLAILKMKQHAKHPSSLVSKLASDGGLLDLGATLQGGLTIPTPEITQVKIKGEAGKKIRIIGVRFTGTGIAIPVIENFVVINPGKVPTVLFNGRVIPLDRLSYVDDEYIAFKASPEVTGVHRGINTVKVLDYRGIPSAQFEIIW